ncbi:MAG: extracellular solute-binding protein [Clostridia bacterium]|nr:extracellular solute-binding protein [Clostridia bacterium]
MFKKLLVFILAPALLLAGCNAHKSGETAAPSETVKTLAVRYDPSKYGEEWLKETAKAFEADNPQVRVKLTADTDILQTMAEALGSSSGLPDLALMPATNWQAYAKNGWLDDLTQLYAMNVDGETIQERIVPGLREYGRLGSSYYVLPWADGLSGIFYNADLFENNGWKVPATSSELQDLLPQIKAEGIAPFAWAGKEQNFWGGVVTAWWGQVEGSEGIASYLAMKNPEVYDQNGRYQALAFFEEIITNTTNSVENSQEMDTVAACEAFFRGKAAMMPGEAWMAAKYKSQIPQGFRMKIMTPPALGKAKTSALVDTMSGDFICIPARAAEKNLAESFAAYLARDTTSELFYRQTGVPSAFNGMPSEAFLRESAAASAAASGTASSGGASSAASSGTATEWSDPFAQSVFELYTRSAKLYMFSSKACYYNQFLDWPGSGEPYMSIFFGERNAKEVFEDDYQYAVENWSKANQ